MDAVALQDLFIRILRAELTGTELCASVKEQLAPEVLPALYNLSKHHDMAHIVAASLSRHELLKDKEAAEHFKREELLAIYRYEQLKFTYEQICGAFEESGIEYMPLKGAVIRNYYKTPWMRTSCDVDILVRKECLEKAIACLTEAFGYTEKEHNTHDVSLFSKSGQHIELHFDLVEEGRARDAIKVLKNVWENASLKKGKKSFYEMSDEFFYFYHIAHMAKHFEVGGCGIRPFIDLWLLDKFEGSDEGQRNALLEKCGLLNFADVARRLSKCWMEGCEIDTVTEKMQNLILSGGVYGTSENRVALQQTKKGGRIGYIFSRLFIPYDKLKRYYPVLEKHRWLTPIMQVRRWGMLFRPGVAQMAKKEIVANNNIEKSSADDMNVFLNEIGL